ncbi:hypothetical protein E3N88_17842 [Mikania micrantha]|uniref:Reverse transcriptase Ty1/copia-type domain-containing protein n=1 Tax=Mikania micrantha TaxID=192012 RepID=A0A5N6NT73_9ASTR|nr:hypothetical protein E3N88_17842 [Mikania micrantha]
MDVKTAFLNDDLDEEIYMKQPESFVLPGNEHNVTPRKFQSRNGRKRAQNNKIGLLGLTSGLGGTPDPKILPLAIHVDEEKGASSASPMRNDCRLYTPPPRLSSTRTICKPHFYPKTPLLRPKVEGSKTWKWKVITGAQRQPSPLVAAQTLLFRGTRGCSCHHLHDLGALEGAYACFTLSSLSFPPQPPQPASPSPPPQMASSTAASPTAEPPHRRHPSKSRPPTVASRVRPFHCVAPPTVASRVRPFHCVAPPPPSHLGFIVASHRLHERRPPPPSHLGLRKCCSPSSLLVQSTPGSIGGKGWSEIGEEANGGRWWLNGRRRRTIGEEASGGRWWLVDGGVGVGKA